MRRMLTAAGLMFMAGCLAGPAPASDADAEIFRLRGDLGSTANIPGPADWRLRLGLESGKWEFHSVLRRRDGELGAAPHRALWASLRLPAGFRLGLGEHQLRTETGSALGRNRGGLPGPLVGGVRLAPGSASRTTPEERGISLARTLGEVRGGLLVSATNRDLRADGRGFVLDTEHLPGRKSRLGAWRDRLCLTWLTCDGSSGWEGHGLLGRRQTPAGRLDVQGLQLIRRRPRHCLAMVWEEGESRLLRAQVVARGDPGWLQADLWRGRQLRRAQYARSSLPLGVKQAGGGVTAQLSRKLEAGGGLALALRWLDRGARTPDRAALWGRLDLSRRIGPAGKGPRLRVQHSLAENRPIGSGLDSWRLVLTPHAPRPLDWQLAWEHQRRPAGRTQTWHLSLRQTWKRACWRGGASFHLLGGEGRGPARLEALGLAPGLLRHAAVSGGRQAWGGGLWLRRGSQGLSVGVLLREVAGEGLPAMHTPSVQAMWSWELR